MLVDTALVLLHGRVIRALSLLRLSSLAPCQRARRLLSALRGSPLIASCFPDIFLSDEPERLNRRGNRLQPFAPKYRRCSEIAAKNVRNDGNRSRHGKIPPDLEELPAVFRDDKREECRVISANGRCSSPDVFVCAGYKARGDV